MRWRRVKAIMVKESLQIVRDPRSLMIALLIPLLQMFMLGYGISLDVEHIPLCAYDREGSQASQALLRRFVASPYFSLHLLAGSYAEAGHALDTGACRIAIVIPAGFSKGLADSGSGVVQALLDATDSNSASIAANGWERSKSVLRYVPRTCTRACSPKRKRWRNRSSVGFAAQCRSSRIRTTGALAEASPSKATTASNRA